MAGKYHYISALAEMTAADIVKNENEWTRFLTTAARLYKYPFNEQMLMYAQDRMLQPVLHLKRGMKR